MQGVRPTITEIRAATQPPGLLDRRSGEHWAGRLYMRRISVYVTALLVRTPVSPNQLTVLMLVAGVAAGAVLAIGGLAGAIAAALLVQLYLLLDCVDGEVARATGRTSITGVYLDRVGHHFADAALLSGLGVRAAEREVNGWLTVGVAAALCAILVKVETDLVDVARARAGRPPVTEEAAELRSRGLGRLRHLASVLRVHRVVQAIELSLFIVAAAVYDQ